MDMSKIKVRLTGGGMDQTVCDQLNTPVVIGDTTPRKVVELVLGCHGLSLDNITDLRQEGDSVVFESGASGMFLSALDRAFYDDEVLRNVDTIEVFFDVTEKIGYKKRSRNGRVSWIIQKERTDLVDKLKSEIYEKSNEETYFAVSEVSRTFEHEEFGYKEVVPFKEFQFYKYDDYDPLALIDVTDEALEWFSEVEPERLST